MATSEDEDDSDRTIAGCPILSHPKTRAIVPFLTFTEGEQPRRLTFPLGGVAIGRAGGVAIPSPDISRRHRRIDLDGGQALVTGLASTNGTFVGGTKVERPTRLEDGDALSPGSFQIRYERRNRLDDDFSMLVVTLL